MPKPKTHQGRIAFVTGAASGIGKAIATRLAAEGACVVVADLDLEKAQAAAAELGGTDVAIGVAANVADADGVQAAIDATVLAFGGIDLVVNNAGLSLSKPLLETTEKDWDLQHDVMAKGSFLVSKAAASALIDQGMGGDVIYISSKNSRVRRPEQHRLLGDEGRPGPPGAPARGRARRVRHPGQRHQPRRRRARLGHLRRRAGAPTAPRPTASTRRTSASSTRNARSSSARSCPRTSRTRSTCSPAPSSPARPACTSRSTPASPPRSCDDPAPAGRDVRRRRRRSTSARDRAARRRSTWAHERARHARHVGPDSSSDAVARSRTTRSQTLRRPALGHPRALRRTSLDGLARRSAREPAIASIGIDSWAVDYGLLRDGRLLGEPFHYRDDRTARGVDAVHERMPHAELYARNGLQFLPFNTLYQLAAEPADLARRPTRALLIPDLFGFWLTGQRRAERRTRRRPACSRARPASGTTSSSPRSACRAASFPRSSSPASGSARCAPRSPRRIGATPTCAVTAVGSHDTASAVVAVPMRAGAAAYISCGTWGWSASSSTRPVLTARPSRANFTNEGGVDGRIRFLHNVMGLWLLSESVRTWERAGAPDRPADAARRGRRGHGTDPGLRRERPAFLPPGDMPARIAAWCAEHDIAPPRTRAEFARSIVESLAQAFADAAREAGRIGGVDVRTIHIVGGGSLNELLCQRTADRAGLPVLAGPVEATAIGNVLVQARALGLVHRIARGAARPRRPHARPPSAHASSGEPHR